MSDDKFLERLRSEARPLRFEPDDMMTTRIAARVRARIAADAHAGVSQILARWFRPVIASLATLAVVATLSIQWVEQSGDATATTLESAATQSVDISVGGDIFSVD
jgi:hypothetical protein